ncbi:tRNA-dihydrouridine synthase family protein [bacterium]|nr:tRNA-dihydrouridine synthase family protein [bacterium]
MSDKFNGIKNNTVKIGENMELVMAPLLAITDNKFRNIYQKYFPYFDYAIAPFISLSDGNKISSKSFTDLHPVDQRMRIIPQLLNHNQESFIGACEFLYYWGYTEINLNLACPARIIMNKGRGAGLLQYPNQIDKILEMIFRKLENQDLTVKLRAGREDYSEFNHLIQVLNRYPIKKVIIHPRTASQMYTGEVNLNVVADAITDLRIPITYSGDIFTIDDFKRLQCRFPTIDSWMIGRGILMNPFLPWFIKGGKKDIICKTKLLNWYEDLFQAFEQYSVSNFYVLGRMKNIWKYLATSFENEEEILSNLLPILNKKKFYEMSFKYLQENDLK